MHEEVTINQLIEELEDKRKRALLMGGEEKIHRHHESGFYTARERIEKLLDAGSFIEFGALSIPRFLVQKKRVLPMEWYAELEKLKDGL